MVDTAWYLRLFYVPIVNVAISMLLYKIIHAKRMTGPGPGRPWAIVYFIGLILLCVLLWFVPFGINLAFWIGISIIATGHVVFALGYSAMREHPEKKKGVVDWGIYKVSRHSHVLAGIIYLLGVIVMGWNRESIVYIMLWVYFVLYIVPSHFSIRNEEKLNIERLGQEYADYMKRIPRYFPIKY